MSNNNKPGHFLVLKLIGFAGIIAAIVGIVLSVRGFGDFETNNFMIGGFLTCFGLFIGVSCLVFGFRPEISKLNTKTARYIQEQTKEDLTAITSNTAEISSEAITNMTKSIKRGLDDKKRCQYCGGEIDADARSCNLCGGKQ
ncbi:MAG: hypothetical protein J6C90_03180 [Clostridia bacterium]|nr:hypothetical protein [Clostridia bacterium]